MAKLCMIRVVFDLIVVFFAALHFWYELFRINQMTLGLSLKTLISSFPPSPSSLGTFRTEL